MEYSLAALILALVPYAVGLIVRLWRRDRMADEEDGDRSKRAPANSRALSECLFFAIIDLSIKVSHRTQVLDEDDSTRRHGNQICRSSARNRYSQQDSRE